MSRDRVDEPRLCSRGPCLQVSALAMTSAPEGSRETLKYRLLGSKEDVGAWGHEYIRHLAGGWVGAPACWTWERWVGGWVGRLGWL